MSSITTSVQTRRPDTHETESKGGYQPPNAFYPENKFTFSNKLANELTLRISEHANRVMNGDSKAKKAYEYFTKYSDSQPLQQLISPFIKYLTYDNLTGASQNLTTVIEICAQRVFDQERDNLEFYVSHGFNHSLNVARYIETIIDSGFQFKGKSLLKHIADNYQINEDKARLVVIMLGFLHDCGYTRLQSTQKKAYHAVHGADLVDPLEAPFLNLIYFPEPNLGLGDPHHLFKDFRNAIFFHCADVAEKDPFNWSIVVNRNEYLFKSSNYNAVKERFLSDPGQLTHLEMNHSANRGRALDNLIGLRYREANFFREPLDMLIRAADNMDISAKRFSPLQNTTVFQQIYRYAHVMHRFSGGINFDQIMTTYINELGANVYGREIRELINPRDPKINEESLYHFGGCECIEDVAFVLEESVIPQNEHIDFIPIAHLAINPGPIGDPVDSDDGSGYYIVQRTAATEILPYLQIKFIEKKFEELSTVPTSTSIPSYLKNTNVFLKEELFVPVAKFQIWRSLEAFQSLNFASEENNLMEKTKKTIKIKCPKLTKL